MAKKNPILTVAVAPNSSGTVIVRHGIYPGGLAVLRSMGISIVHLSGVKLEVGGPWGHKFLSGVATFGDQSYHTVEGYPPYWSSHTGNVVYADRQDNMKMRRLTGDVLASVEFVSRSHLVFDVRPGLATFGYGLMLGLYREFLYPQIEGNDAGFVVSGYYEVPEIKSVVNRWPAMFILAGQKHVRWEYRLLSNGSKIQQIYQQ